MILIPGLALTAAIHAATPALDNITVLAAERAVASNTEPTSWSERPWPESTYVRRAQAADVGDTTILDLEELLLELLDETASA